jgi:ribonuclease Z
MTKQNSTIGQPQMKVTLLGTGTPIPNVRRFGPATLVEAGGKMFLFDAGRGAAMRLLQAGISIGQVDVLFLTHFHSDHLVGLPDIWLSGWSPSPFGRREGPFRVIGPAGARDMMRHLELAFAADIAIRMAEGGRTRAGLDCDIQEIACEGVVFNEDGVRVTVFDVDHGKFVKPAYGYRIDHAGHSVLLSGDTRPNENVVKHGAGVDVLIHTVLMAPPGLNLVQAGHHSTPRDAGTIFARAKPRLAVYTHIGIQNRPGYPQVGVDDILRLTRETYIGPLQIGEDLMSFEVDANNVKVINSESE